MPFSHNYLCAPNHKWERNLTNTQFGKRERLQRAFLNVASRADHDEGHVAINESAISSLESASPIWGIRGAIADRWADYFEVSGDTPKNRVDVCGSRWPHSLYRQGFA